MGLSQVMELMEKIEILKNDEDADVAEASDDMDFRLLNQRKQLAEKYAKLEEESQARVKLLNDRSDNEKEEREKRQKEEEENKYTFCLMAGSQGLETRRHSIIVLFIYTYLPAS